jgi:hypothetical protein
LGSRRATPALFRISLALMRAKMLALPIIIRISFKLKQC